MLISNNLSKYAKSGKIRNLVLLHILRHSIQFTFCYYFHPTWLSFIKLLQVTFWFQKYFWGEKKFFQAQRADPSGILLNPYKDGAFLMPTTFIKILKLIFLRFSSWLSRFFTFFTFFKKVTSLGRVFRFSKTLSHIVTVAIIELTIYVLQKLNLSIREKSVNKVYIWILNGHFLNIFKWKISGLVFSLFIRLFWLKFHWTF